MYCNKSWLSILNLGSFSKTLNFMHFLSFHFSFSSFIVNHMYTCFINLGQTYYFSICNQNLHNWGYEGPSKIFYDLLTKLRTWMDREMGLVKILIFFLRFERSLGHQFWIVTFQLSLDVKLSNLVVIHKKKIVWSINT